MYDPRRASRLRRGLLVLALLGPWSPARAEPDPADGEPDAATPPIEALRTATGLSPEHLQAAEHLLGRASVLLDYRADPDERALAAEDLGQTGDPRALWFLRPATRDRDPQVQQAALRGARQLRVPDAAALAQEAMSDPLLPRETQLAGVELAAALDLPEAGHALWEVASDRATQAMVRARAVEALRAGYPEILAARGEPRTGSEPLGSATVIGASGLIGGVVLAGVGEWGQLDAGPGIGAAGGTILGAGLAGAYTSRQPITGGQGLAYASAVGWGLAAGSLGHKVAYGAPRFTSWSDRNLDVEALFRTVGTVAGAGVGVWALRRDLQPADVLETDLAGYLGSALALSAADLAFYRPPTTDRSADWQGYHARNSRLRSGATLMGAAAGLGIGAALTDSWSLTTEDAALAGILGLEGMWLGLWLPKALDVDDTHLRGTVRLPWHLGMIGGLAWAHLQPPSHHRIGMTAYGTVAGNALGAGLSLMAGHHDERTLSQVMLPVGAVGTAAGALTGDWLEPDTGAWTLASVGGGLAMAQAGTVTWWLYDRDVVRDEVAIPGAILTVGALTSGGLLVASRDRSPRPDRVLTAGSAAIWGAWFGAMVPVGLDLDLAPSDHALTSTLVSDAFLIAGGIALSPRFGLQPAQTLPIHLGGVAGATGGALGTAMFTPEASHVALGSVIGTVVGMGTGALLGSRRSEAPARRLTLPSPSFQLLPTVRTTQEGTVLYGIGATGW